ncbi:hypothetical protein TNCV_4402971 [Trichonephila clavipes]|uniref:Uncharacterized protein n=1 Tax=Trichonephila clavipes TaxID=2585209 RepID=A0A8X6VGX5_TRICX|nr:hypothetical protein TNCV_4402971 [Trichonephila clavipes]
MHVKSVERPVERPPVGVVPSGGSPTLGDSLVVRSRTRGRSVMGSKLLCAEVLMSVKSVKNRSPPVSMVKKFGEGDESSDVVLVT